MKFGIGACTKICQNFILVYINPI